MVSRTICFANEKPKGSEAMAALMKFKSSSFSKPTSSRFKMQGIAHTKVFLKMPRLAVSGISVRCRSSRHSEDEKFRLSLNSSGAALLSPTLLSAVTHSSFAVGFLFLLP